jgi:nickel transport protein
MAMGGVFLAGIPLTVCSHGIRLEKTSSALSVQALDERDSPVTEGDVTVFPSNDSTSLFRQGKLDGEGRFSFYPDRPGGWRVVVKDGRGHRSELVLEGEIPSSLVRPDRLSRILAGVGFLFGLFGLWAFYLRRTN